MIKRPDTRAQRIKRHARVRGKISGTAERPRLSVFRSENHIAERALAKGIEEVVFDRGGYIFHGRVAALAEGAREGGLKF